MAQTKIYVLIRELRSLSNHDDERKTTTGSVVNVSAQAQTKNSVVVLSSTTWEGPVSRRRELPKLQSSFFFSLKGVCLVLIFLTVYGRL